MSAITLDGFCHHLADGRGPYGRLYPSPLAREFVDFFGLSAFPRMEEITTTLERHDVATIVLSHDIRGLRGYHTGEKGGAYQITLDAAESVSAREHTALHETYEIVRERLHDLYPHVGKPYGTTKCRQADRFAASALMQPRWFSPFRRGVGVRRGRPPRDLRSGLLLPGHKARRGDAPPAAALGAVRAGRGGRAVGVGPKL